MEAVGRPESWRAAIEAARPGGTVVLVGGCPSGCDVTLPSGPLHYAELDVRGAFHHTPAEVDRALALLASGDVDWRALAGETIGLDELADGARAPVGGRGAQARRRSARVVHPSASSAGFPAPDPRLTAAGACPRATSTKAGHQRPSDHGQGIWEFPTELTAGRTSGQPRRSASSRPLLARLAAVRGRTLRPMTVADAQRVRSCARSSRGSEPIRRTLGDVTHRPGARAPYTGPPSRGRTRRPAEASEKSIFAVATPSPRAAGSSSPASTTVNQRWSPS